MDHILDLTEAEDIKKRWQEYTEELSKKDLHDPENHDGVVTHLEPDTLLFHFHQEAFEFLLTFCHKGGVICISEVIDISPAILIPACASSSPAFLMMYSSYKLNKQGDNIQL